MLHWIDQRHRLYLYGGCANSGGAFDRVTPATVNRTFTDALASVWNNQDAVGSATAYSHAKPDRPLEQKR
jgi:hypothetical protein